MPLKAERPRPAPCWVPPLLTASEGVHPVSPGRRVCPVLRARGKKGRTGLCAMHLPTPCLLRSVTLAGTAGAAHAGPQTGQSTSASAFLVVAVLLCEMGPHPCLVRPQGPGRLPRPLNGEGARWAAAGAHRHLYTPVFSLRPRKVCPPCVCPDGFTLVGQRLCWVRAHPGGLVLT